MAKKKSPVREADAHGELEDVYHDIRQTFRVTGINLNFRTWASFDGVLELFWGAMRDNAGALAFELAADQLRERAVLCALEPGPVRVLEQTRLGESQRFQVIRALELYHYVNPKLLLFTSAVRLALEGTSVGRGERTGQVQRVPRGPPPRMAEMEMVDEGAADRRVRRLFGRIQKTLGLRSVNSDYRTLALWPDYLERAWAGLEPLVREQAWSHRSEELRALCRALTATLPYRVELNAGQLKALKANPKEVLRTTAYFEELLPGLTIQIAALTVDAQGRADATTSRHSATPTPSSASREVQ
jgi:hypothetical protein